MVQGSNQLRTNVFYKQFLFGIILLMIMTPESSSSKESAVLRYSGSMQPVCSAWAKIFLGEYVINNNIWGKGNINDYTQCIIGILNPQSGAPDNIGWSWSWPKASIGVKAYPSILYGHKPWNDYSTTARLPQAINQLKHLTVSYKLKTVSSGAVNLLLESWITRTDKPSPVDRVGELAVQLYQKNWPGQAGRYVESIVINGITFDFYIEKEMRVPSDTHTWAYYGFVHKGAPVLQAKLDIMKFVNYLVNHGYVNRKHYIATVELGNEVDHGEGRTEIEYFSVKGGF